MNKGVIKTAVKSIHVKDCDVIFENAKTKVEREINAIWATHQDLLKKIAEKEGFANAEIIEPTKNELFMGYLSHMYFFTFRKDGKEISFVIKFAPVDDPLKPQRDQCGIREHYLNESLFYQNVWPLFEELQREYLGRIAINPVPKVYNVELKDGAEYLVFENLKSKNYEMFNKRMFFDRQHLELIFKTYAEYHSLSFVLRERNLETFTKLANKCVEIFYTMDDKLLPSGLRQTYKELYSYYSDGSDDVLKEKLLEYTKSLSTFENSLKYERKYPVFAHGDCWSNNMMFKYDKSAAERNRKVVSMKLIDFQHLRPRSVVHDLSYALYSGGSKSDFDNLDHYLQLYHKHLTEILSRFNLDTKSVYPFEELKQEWVRFCKYGYSMAILLIKVKQNYEQQGLQLLDIITSDKNIRELADGKYDQEAAKIKHMDLVQHMYERNWL